ncbi:CRTAC1 family protein [Thioalkalivibrio paradoxus]|uniref:RNA-binding protein n=1 Tax=Thioalkalivibrio paradoxus ARh 1 TaxID=713585 RepID=W0DM94_9GAMM|nr:CRTAC1 family protein [Thioalkalivibrio paradoxus]AHE98113.1 RNA-binding protein [Thioalkalivibrio paradoxus ARh 1]
MNDRPSERSSLEEVGGDARIARMFRYSVIAASVLTVLVLAVLLAWWWIAREEPETVDEIPIAAPEPLAPPVTGGPPALTFTDITREAGIDFTHVNGAYGERLLPETIGAGVAVLDYNNSGHPDILLVNSSYWPGHEGPERPRLTLYENDGTGRFTDVTERAGLDVDLYGMGVAVGDYDNDGWVDVFITAVGTNRLFRNEQGRFREVTDKAGVGGLERDWSTAAAFFDSNNNGLLDLYVGNYVEWSPEIDLEIDFRLTGLGRAYGAPNHFNGVHGYLYRNNGDGTFTDVSAEAGIQVVEPGTGRAAGKALGVVAIDYDGDGWMDLVVANDTVRNFLFRNRGDGTFEEVGAFEGVAFDRDGSATGAMGIDAAWFRNDDDLGIAIGNFANEPSSLYVTADGEPPFADEAMIDGIAGPTRLALTFGVLFIDVDLNGRLDFLQANGHLEHEINTVHPSQHYEQPGQLFWNCGEACATRFVEVSDPGDLATPMAGRAMAYADFDGDGDLDLIVTQNGRPAVLLRNDQDQGHHWLRVRLVGTQSNRDAIGAEVRLTAGGETQRRLVSPTRSYLAQVELPVTFGLGDHDTVDRLEIRWPSGVVQEVEVSAVNRQITVVEPDGEDTQ